MKKFIGEHKTKLILFTLVCIAFIITEIDETTLNYLVNSSQYIITIIYKILKQILINIFTILNILETILKIIKVKDYVFKKNNITQHKNSSNIDISIHIKIHKR